ncbi:TPA: DinB family protein [Elizabethkingia anophelis]|uniref:DinB family protein n=1 Tax=Elizabethkingia anophelis TaxID=1117645 RepID=UPI00299205DB|nr:DinB family protein [Elizabethkingia anophelis]HBN6708020.1 DinB family protein [Elizabethkingia anophelis]HBN6712054.1 DinB family protein [Elizabethkingia anophelis]HBN6715913.1 DinB family protein [Elizabethkingia anophelis]HBN6720378.1 DinB family protein [Elizabethkingia anophelis]
MEALFKTWKTSRRIYLSYFENYSLDQLNNIPNGFNNNLIWNIGHIIVTQQKLIYRGSDLQGYISDELFNKYQSGTKPTEPVFQKEAAELKELLTSLIDLTIADFQKDIFRTYKERITGTGFHLSSINDAFECNNYHEGMHLGYMLSIRKFV